MKEWARGQSSLTVQAKPNQYCFNICYFRKMLNLHPKIRMVVILIRLSRFSCLQICKGPFPVELCRKLVASWPFKLFPTCYTWCEWGTGYLMFPCVTHLTSDLNVPYVLHIWQVTHSVTHGTGNLNFPRVLHVENFAILSQNMYIHLTCMNVKKY